MEEVDAEKLGALSLEGEVQEAGEQGADEESDGGQFSDDEEDEDPGPEDEVEFEAWLRCEMEKMPLFKAFAETFDKAILAVQRLSPGMDAPHTRADALRCRPKTNPPPLLQVLAWRKRFYGNPRLWKRIWKRTKVIKEVAESVPVVKQVPRAPRWRAARPARPAR